MSKLVKIGDVPWDRNDIESKLDDFMKLYEKRPIINNRVVWVHLIVSLHIF